jgi:hypothetical protein
MFNFIKDPIRKIVTRIIEADSINVSTCFLHQQTFSDLKNICKGKEIVVCGAGPSLQKYQPIEGAVHIAVNRAFTYEKVEFDYIFSQDYDGLRMVQNELINYRPGKCIKLLGTQYGSPKKEIPESLVIKCGARRFNTDTYIYADGYKSRFIRDIDRMPIGNMPNVGLSVMQLALFMNPSRIYIVGCDMSGGHFSNPNMSEKEIKEMNQTLDKTWSENHQRLIDKWKELRDFTKIYYPDTELVSINPVGLKGMFRDIYQ